MTTVHEIETALKQLPRRELAKFRTWYEDFDNALWDKQFRSDVSNGKLDSLAQEALKEFQNSDVQSLG